MSEENTISEENTKATKKYYDYISVGNRTKQTAYFVQQHDKNRMFLELLKTLENKQILVLVKSKKSADGLMEFLKEKEVKSISVHGNNRASQIEAAQTAFNAKETTILITTDRILDTLTLNDINVVVRYDLPLDEPDYFKRLRLVDEIGESISLIDPEDENTLATIELMMKCEMTEVEIENFEHTNRSHTNIKDRLKKPRHKKVEQRAKRKAAIKSKWVPAK
jgi:superfamily II DNA/RNA helicase